MSDFKPYLGQRVLLHLDDIEIEGTLSRESDSAVVLTKAALRAVAADATPIDGEVIVDRLRIAWTQVP